LVAKVTEVSDIRYDKPARKQEQLQGEVSHPPTPVPPLSQSVPSATTAAVRADAPATPAVTFASVQDFQNFLSVLYNVGNNSAFQNHGVGGPQQSVAIPTGAHVLNGLTNATNPQIHGNTTPLQPFIVSASSAPSTVNSAMQTLLPNNNVSSGAVPMIRALGSNNINALLGQPSSSGMGISFADLGGQLATPQYVCVNPQTNQVTPSHPQVQYIIMR
jgi:hypothetical protein